MSMMDNIRLINSVLMDEKSKSIFTNRLMFEATQDFGYLNKILPPVFDSSKQYILWGRGYWAKEIIKCYPSVKWLGVCDNNVIGQKKDEGFEQLQIINFEDGREGFPNAVYVIGTRLYNEEIFKQLIDNGIKKDCIVNMGRIQQELSEQMYFDLPFMSPAENEIFIDGGCYDGISSLGFASWSNNNYKKIYAFEPDKRNAIKCREQFEKNNIRDIIVYSYALTSKKKKINFNMNGSVFSGADEFTDTRVDGVDLDTVISEKVTFIKLDIEGGELDALQGMKRHIENEHPKLAISIYHKQEDIIKIPLFLLGINPNYKLYLRHYSIGRVDTVLYAI